MRRRHVLARLALVPFAALALSEAAHLAGRRVEGAGHAQPAAWKAPTTPGGAPDLQGIWTYATMTPLERPRELAGMPVLS